MMFENDDVYEIVLFMSDITDYESMNFSYGVFTCYCQFTAYTAN